MASSQTSLDSALDFDLGNSPVYFVDYFVNYFVYIYFSKLLQSLET